MCHTRQFLGTCQQNRPSPSKVKQPQPRHRRRRQTEVPLYMARAIPKVSHRGSRQGGHAGTTRVSVSSSATSHQVIVTASEGLQKTLPKPRMSPCPYCLRAHQPNPGCRVTGLLRD